MNNPYVNINRVIDTSTNQRRAVDFLHIRSVSNPFTIAATGFITPGSPDINGAEYYQFSDMQLENKLRLTHVPIIVIDKNADATLDKDNFPTCYVKNVGGFPKLFLWSKAAMVSGDVQIISIILMEAGKTLAEGEITRGLTNGSGSGGSSGAIDLSEVSYDAATFISYLNQLGNVATDVDQIQDFLDGLTAGITTRSLTADFIKAGTVDATKMTVHGPNIITSFDSFEQFGNKSLLGVNGVTSSGWVMPNGANVINTHKYHGAHSLRLQADTGAAWIYLNPYTDLVENWLSITKPGRYIFSFYQQCPTTLNNEVGKVSLVDVTSTPVEIAARTIIGTGTQEGFTRRWINFNVAAASEVSPVVMTLKVDLNAGIVCYLDALQLEEAETEFSSPYPFASGGTTVISGDSIITGTIDAEKATITNIDADNITAGSISGSRIAANTITGDMIAAGAITADKAIIDTGAIFSAMINDLSASKISAGTINASIVTVADIDNALVLAEGKMTAGYMTEAGFYAAVEMGKIQYTDPIEGEKTFYGLIVRDESGTAILDANGLTSLGLTNGLQTIPDDAGAVLTGAVIKDNTIQGKTLVAEAISAREILAGSITADEIAANTITAANIKSETITVNKLVPSFGTDIDITGNVTIQGIRTDIDDQALRYSFGPDALTMQVPNQSGKIELGVNGDIPYIELSDGSGTSATARIESGTMSIDTAVILTSITIGQHKITKYDTGSSNFITIFQQI